MPDAPPGAPPRSRGRPALARALGAPPERLYGRGAALAIVAGPLRDLPGGGAAWISRFKVIAMRSTSCACIALVSSGSSPPREPRRR